MACFHPLTAYVGAGRSRNGGRVIVFKESDSPSGESLKLSCGQCLGCRLAHSCELAIRAVHESTLHEDNSFLTLTYDDEHLPSSGSLVRSDPQKFLRRLRKAIAPKRVRFFGCGEYGETLGRPHYHLCLFGFDPSDKEVIGKSVDGDPLYSSALLSEVWPHGFVSVGSLTFESAAYVARYSLKKLNGPRAEAVNPRTGFKHYEAVDSSTGELCERRREFPMFSLKPGIGRGWLDRYWSDAFPSDFLVHEGRKLPVPKAYRRYLLEVDERLAGELALKREAAGAERADDRTPERLAVREECARRRIEDFSARGVRMAR